MAAQPCWAVRGTKKGDLPVAAEKRGQHSVVVIRNVERPALLASEIQKALGAGGSVSAAGDVEVQGKKLLRRVQAFLKGRPAQLRGVRRDKAAQPAAAAPASTHSLEPTPDERRRAS
eukprot:COSAG04_NODE_4953_length_1809_cov_1.576023_1_plen_116_part_10